MCDGAGSTKGSARGSTMKNGDKIVRMFIDSTSIDESNNGIE